MVAASDVLIVIHFTLLVGLLSVTTLLLMVTVTNRLRARKALMAWQASRLFGVPVWPSIYLVLLGAGLIYAASTGRPLHVALEAGYVTAGAFWLVSSWLAKTVVVTEEGIVTDLSCAEHSMSWSRVSDFFEFEQSDRQGYVFFHTDARGVRRRLNLSVPRSCQKGFREIVASKLDARFDVTSPQIQGKTALEK
ncbi:MAG TPA: hypothetical protein VFG50_05030 [Rhodothermales bacterium]|nr:hypothetical protein [Rhodothermales bacterium]